MSNLADCIAQHAKICEAEVALRESVAALSPSDRAAFNERTAKPPEDPPRMSSVVVDGALTLHLRERSPSLAAEAEDFRERRDAGLSEPGEKREIPRSGGGFALEKTDNFLVLRPELDSVEIRDVDLASDWFYKSKFWTWVYGVLFYPGAYMYLLLAAPWTPIWGPFAVSHMIGRPLSTTTNSVLALPCSNTSSIATAFPCEPTLCEGFANTTGCVDIEITEPSTWSFFCYYFWAVYMVSMIPTVVTGLLFYHPTMMKLIWRRDKWGILLAIGSRAVYTVAAISYFPDTVNILNLAHVLIVTPGEIFRDADFVTQRLRNTKASQETGSANALQQLALIVSFAGYSFEVLRHFAILYALDTASASRHAFDVVPASWFGEELAFSNVQLMNVTFATYIVIVMRGFLKRLKSGNRLLGHLTTSFYPKVFYEDDMADYENTLPGAKLAGFAAKVAPSSET